MAQKRVMVEVCESRKMPRVTELLAALPQSEERDLLLHSLPHAAEIGGEKRHPFQTEVLKMAGEALKTMHSEAVNTRAGFVTNAAEAKANSDAAAETHAACLQRKEAAALERDGCAALALQAEDSFASAELEQSRSETARNRILEERSKLEAEKTHSEKFLNGGWEGMEVTLVQEHLSAMGAEPALIAAVPGAMAVQPEQRGAFDSIATQALTSCLSERAEKLDSLLAKNQTEAKAASSFALGAWAFADMAKGQAAAAAEKVTEAEKSLTSVTAELKKISASVTAQEKVLKFALTEEAQANGCVQEIESGLAELQHVLENDTVKPIAIEPEPVVESAPEPVLETNTVPAVLETNTVPAVPVLAKSDDLHTPAMITPESISVGGC